MEFRDIVAALRSGWWLVVLGLVVGGAAALGLSLRTTPLYTSTIQFFVTTTGSTTTAEVFQGGQFSEQRIASYAQLLEGDEMAGRVVDRLDLDRTPAQLMQQITVTPVPDTVVVNVTVTDPSAERAHDIAAAIGDEFTDEVGALEAPVGADEPPVRVTVTNQPDVATSPATPSTERNVAVGLAGGAFLGGAVAMARRRFDRSVKGPDEAAKLAGAPVIGVVLEEPAIQREQALVTDSSLKVAEDFRRLRTSLQFVNVDAPPKSIMITSALPAEGKSTTAVNLALALADAGRTVTLIEADMRRPRVTKFLGMVSGVGLTNILAGTADVDEVVQRFGDRKLSVIGSGATPPNPGELLGSEQMATLLAELRDRNDFVLLDAPPVLPVADATGLATMVDGVLLSVRYGHAHSDQVRQAAHDLERVGGHLLGVILNIVPAKSGLATTRAYGYGYEPEQSAGGSPNARRSARQFLGLRRGRQPLVGGEQQVGFG
jgi:capsular exopolysaccharide synthesis family protein